MKNIVDFETFESIYDAKSYIALGRELYVDLETPVSIFLKVSKGKNSFLLDVFSIIFISFGNNVKATGFTNFFSLTSFTFCKLSSPNAKA